MLTLFKYFKIGYLLLIIFEVQYCNLLYDWVCFRHAIGQFAVHNLLYGPKFLKKMLISEV